MTKYPKYRASGIEWLGEIPVHWEVNRFKRVILTKARLGWKGLKASEYVPEGYGFLSTPNIKDVHIDFDNINFITQERYLESPEIMLQEGDVLLAKDGSTLGITNVVRNLPFPSTVNSSIAVLRPSSGKVNSVYVMYFLSSHFMQTLIDLKKDGMGVPHLFQRDINHFAIILPPLPEQRAIATYLDRQTQALEELIADKRRLIELYQEERAALINQAVTRGLDPTMPMKDSGIEWLGEIPAHWEVKRLKYVVSKVGSGITPKGGAEVYLNEGIPLLRSQNIHFDGIRLDDVAYIAEEVDEQMSNSRVNDCDVLLNITGASIGRCYYVDSRLGPANVNQHVCILRPNRHIQTRYLNYLLASEVGQIQIVLSQTGSGREGLNFEQLRRFNLSYPPIKEQSTLVSFLDTKTSQLDQQIADTEREVELLQEYRTALISEVVTGKVDVRE